jgi:TonB family protein
MGGSVSTSFYKRNGAVVLIAVFLLMLSTVFAADEGGRKLKNRVAPQYPELARRVNAKGTVKIEVVIAPNGTIKSTKVIGGHPLLVNAAEDAVKKWRYEPASEETTTVIEFNFTPGM